MFPESHQIFTQRPILIILIGRFQTMINVLESFMTPSDVLLFIKLYFVLKIQFQYFDWLILESEYNDNRARKFYEFLRHGLNYKCNKVTKTFINN